MKDFYNLCIITELIGACLVSPVFLVLMIVHTLVYLFINQCLNGVHRISKHNKAKR